MSCTEVHAYHYCDNYKQTQKIVLICHYIQSRRLRPNSKTSVAKLFANRLRHSFAADSEEAWPKSSIQIRFLLSTHMN